MASIYKRGGKRNREGKYIASYFDEHGKRVEKSTGTSDRGVAGQIAAKWETEVALRRRGIINAAQAKAADHNRTPIIQHVKDYLDHCEHVGQDGMHIGNKRTQLNALVAGVGATRLSDLEPNTVERYLSSLVKAGKSHRTHNQHRVTVVAFVEWCVGQGRMESNPLRIVPTLNEAKDRRRVRRALTEDEVVRLVAVSPERGLYYLFAYYTGFRVKAVKATTWGDVDWEAGTIRVRVGNGKGKKDDVYYSLHPRLGDELRKLKPVFNNAGARIFRSVPTIRTFHRDCERAKIDRYDDEGRQIDRHALRTTLGTHLARAGVLPQQAMKVLGHADVRVTMRHYTDLRLTDTARALRSLPAIGLKDQPKGLKATGTESASSVAVSKSKDGGFPIQQKQQQSGGFRGHSLSLDGSNEAGTEDRNGKADDSESLGNHSLSLPDLVETGDAATLSKTGAFSSVG